MRQPLYLDIFSKKYTLNINASKNIKLKVTTNLQKSKKPIRVQVSIKLSTLSVKTPGS